MELRRLCGVTLTGNPRLSGHGRPKLADFPSGASFAKLVRCGQSSVANLTPDRGV